jgi:hypothetical protein
VRHAWHAQYGSESVARLFDVASDSEHALVSLQKPESTYIDMNLGRFLRS